MRPEPAQPDKPVAMMFRAELAEVVREVLIDLLADGKSSTPPALLSQTELAEQLGVSPATVRTLRGQGLPTVWVVESPRFVLTECLDWLRARSEERAE